MNVKRRKLYNYKKPKLFFSFLFTYEYIIYFWTLLLFFVFLLCSVCCIHFILYLCTINEYYHYSILPNLLTAGFHRETKENWSLIFDPCILYQKCGHLQCTQIKKLLTFKIILAWIYEPTFEAKTGRAKEMDWAKSAPQLDFSMRDLRKIYKRPDIVAVIR